MDNKWNHEAGNFAMDNNNDYEKAFESYISDVDDDDEDFNADNYSHLYQPEQHQQQHLDENQQINEIFIEIPPPNMRLDLCPVCSRRFAPETLLKHILICERISTKKRKPFDSSRQRLKGTEFIASTSASVETPTSRISPPKILQRKTSETSLKSHPIISHDQRSNFDAMSRKSSTISLSSSASRPVVKRTTSQPTPEKCPYCERIFGFKAYDRHVEWCKEKSLIKPNPDPKAVSIAKERLKTRISYKAPNLKTKRGATREKYSNSCNGSTNSLAEFDSTLNSMSSSITSENGGYDPFMNAKKQLAELFSPTTPTTQMINSMMVPNSTSNIKSININGSKNNDIMSKSLFSPKTPQPIPKIQSNFRRTSSLRISNRKNKPLVYTPPVRSNIHCGITDDGPISPNFVKATDYDELPIKSPYSAIKLCEKSPPPQSNSSSPSPTLPTVSNNNNMLNTPKMREKSDQLIRKNLKLDLKNIHAPSSSDYPLSKTDSLALFLKYENDLAAEMSEKERKDKSNSLSKRSATLNSNFMLKDQKLPDINGKSLQYQKTQNNNSSINESVKEEKELITIDKIKTYIKQESNEKDENAGQSIQSAPVKLINACDNLPLLNNNNDKSRSPSLDSRESPEKIITPTSGRRSGNALRRQMKYNIDNILFDTDPLEVKSTTPSVSNENNNNSVTRPESRISNTESIFEDFDFDQFIASFTDDEKFPIFKDYKMLLNNSVKADEENNNVKDISKKNNENVNVVSKPIPIQQNSQQQQQQQYNQKTESELTGMEKLDNLCKMLSGNSDSDDSNTDPSEAQTTRSKSSADSAYGSLSRQSQSPLDYRKIHSTTRLPIQHQIVPPPVPQRQHLELKTTEIVLNPIKQPNLQENILIPRNGNLTVIRSTSNEEKSDNSKLSKFCHMCGYKFVVATAKFCIECGVRRIKV
ncbi:hypothetical protein PVAND_006739 [Polypedilum vanderplanki]|uniref:C2HC/C3H-type domain-containing protein n=1 Tax=Polypedilum vanderplanki TaxID=319348 RepID=A0A9J6C470_POLVA|nr:hypothetical protein PVAND_006739 [Polypedilum vanderplanki]